MWSTLVLREMSCRIPTSTPAFQAALMYGVHPDIPGFHWYDKRLGADLYVPRPGIADLVERRHATGRRGIMEEGSCDGCVFSGGARENLWTFARLTRLDLASGSLVRVLASAFNEWLPGRLAPSLARVFRPPATPPDPPRALSGFPPGPDLLGRGARCRTTHCSPEPARPRRPGSPASGRSLAAVSLARLVTP